jgi:SAM-dependent methyltransferase
MANWTAGYVADIDYTYGFYRELTPALLAYVGLAQGKRTPDPDGPMTYCELGSGLGLTTNLLAAANPQIEFHATDFLPAHVVEARRLASAAGSDNAHFYEDSFAEFGRRDDLPMFDIISLHGIYSWITPENRGVIVDFVRRKLKPGGLLYVSYNTLGWAASMPLRELMYRFGATQGGGSVARFENAMGLMEKLLATNARYFAANPAVKHRFEGLRSMDRSYLTHEYFNEAWHLLYHADVAEEFAEAKLNFLGSANLIEHIDMVNFSEPQREILAAVADPSVREMVKDFLGAQQFRRDVFVKGASPLGPTEASRLWLSQRFALSVARSAAPTKAPTLQGEATLQPEVYNPLFDALADGPKTLAELIADPSLKGQTPPRLQQALSILIGGGSVQPCLSASGDAARAKRTRAFNDAVIARAHEGGIGFLASPVTGGGVGMGRFQQIFLGARARKADPVQTAWDLLSSIGQSIVREGKALEGAEANKAEIAKELADFEANRLPVLQQLGVA